jgi:pimeloyl-ACP methyl ester carboxylesterase
MPAGDLYPFETRKYEIDGHRLSCVDEGEGRTIVMLHGNPTWSFYYRNLILRLRRRYRVIVPDHMGCGLSDKPQDYPYRLERHARNVESLLSQLNVGRHSLVVHDWGGAIGMNYARRNPGRVEALVLLNTAAFRSMRIPFRIRVCRVPLFGPLAVRGLNLFVRGALRMAVTRPMDRDTKEMYLLPYRSWADRVAILRFIEDIPLDSGHPSWAALVKAEEAIASFAETPTLILWGGEGFLLRRSLPP